MIKECADHTHRDDSYVKIQIGTPSEDLIHGIVCLLKDRIFTWDAPGESCHSLSDVEHELFHVPLNTPTKAKPISKKARSARGSCFNEASCAGVRCTTCPTGVHIEKLSIAALGADDKSLSDEELLAFFLCKMAIMANARKVAQNLIQRFTTLGAVVSARHDQLLRVEDVDESTISIIKMIGTTATRLAREDITRRPALSDWGKLISYLRVSMAHQTVEQFRIIFLDRRNVMILDEVQNQGTIDHTPVYPREIVRRSLDLDAAAIIMVHNHPSNHPAPSKTDIDMTRQVLDILSRIGIVLHDHVIISRSGHSSFRELGLI